MTDLSSRYRDLLRAPSNRCVPDLYPVAEDEIHLALLDPSIHRDLEHVWKAFGYGFFSSGSDGSRLTNASNRLYPPDELAEVSFMLAEVYGLDVGKLGTPFFETVDYCFFHVAAEGEVVDETGDVVAATLPEFFVKMLADPDFRKD